METLVALLALTSMEIVLGIDNIVFIAILVDRLPEDRQAGARAIGLGLALIIRILLLLMISWIMTWTKPLVQTSVISISGRDLVLLLGGLFLIAKSTTEIYEKVEGHKEYEKKVTAEAYFSVIAQIVLIDIVFSLDSVITAVGMVDELWLMVTAVIISILFMLIFSGSVAKFVNENPSVKVLALSFLILIGVLLVAEGMGQHLPRGYVYFAMAFSLAIEMLNLRARKKRAVTV